MIKLKDLIAIADVNFSVGLYDSNHNFIDSYLDFEEVPKEYHNRGVLAMFVRSTNVDVVIGRDLEGCEP
jgi:hypothetical protein